MPRFSKALLQFIDGSFLFAELGKKVEGTDNMILCFKILGLPNGVAADKPTIAVAIERASKSGPCVEVAIPCSRISSITIQEEYMGKEIPSDMKSMWSETQSDKKPGGQRRNI